MAQPQVKPPMFQMFEDVLDWERLQDTRHALLDGVPIAMAGASEGHNIIQGNIFAALLTGLRGGPCRPFSSDMAVRIGVRKGRYPDVTVDCGPQNPENRSLPSPTIVFEVLSPDTQGQDRTVKLWEYMSFARLLITAWSISPPAPLRLQPWRERRLHAQAAGNPRPWRHGRVACGWGFAAGG